MLYSITRFLRMMLIFIVGVIVIFSTTTDGCYEAQAGCPVGWTRNRNTCYLLVKEPSSWWEAVEKCSAVNSYLMYVETEDEADYVTAVAKRNTRIIWIGGTDEFKEGNFIWHSTGKPMIISNWDAGQPNNAAGGQHHVFVGSNGKWHDQVDSEKYWFICKKQIEICSCRPVV